MLYVICVSVAAPLILMTEVFSSGPAGADTAPIASYLVVSAVIAILAGGGISIMGWSFKVPAVLSVYGGFYVGAVSMMTTLFGQMLHPIEVAVTISAAFVVLCSIVGVLGALEIAGGAHGPME